MNIERADGTRPRRVFRAYGVLDKQARHWADLPPVGQSCGVAPRGDELVYRINRTTLEVGQGASTFRGYVGLAAVAFLAAVCFGLWVSVSIDLTSDFDRTLADVGWPMLLFGYASNIVLMLVAVALLALVVNEFFGVVDAPVRFDRTRGKVYVWVDRKAGPIELDWHAVKPVAQSASAPPYQVNAFRSVLLVDEDPDGEVRFEGRVPRIAQIGAAVLDREHTLAAYEFVRVFMERGPQALPPVNEHLSWRVGPRSFVDIFGLIKATVRDWPQRPEHQRSIGLLITGVVAMTLVSAVFWPFQLAQGLALRTTRIPRWPDAYERQAAEGGPLRTPPGSVPNDPPMRPHEMAVAALWVGSAMAVYGLLAWAALRR